MKELTQQEQDIYEAFGMNVSVHHDRRYYSKKIVEENNLTPTTLTEEVKEILIKKHGENWKDIFFGEDYDKNFT